MPACLMNDTPAISAIRRFLSVLRDGDPPSDERLAYALDELVMAYHAAPEGEPAKGDPHPPDKNWNGRYASLGKRFPQLGYYAVADPAEAVNNEPMCGDGIDDLADIEGDLREALWRFENLGADDAHWHFKLSFRSHWGRHARSLAFYLHAKTW